MRLTILFLAPWILLAQSTWTSSVSYSRGARVSYLGSVCTATQPNRNLPPGGHPEAWTCIVVSTPPQPAPGGVTYFKGRTGSVTPATGDYTAAQVTNAVDSSQTYSNPLWLTGLAWSKITGVPATLMSCQPGYGDGLNAIQAGTYLQTNCYNDTGVTVTISGIKCYTDNTGTSTLAVTNGAGTALLTGAVTCTPSFAAGSQSATVTIANGDFLKFTFVADGTSKQTTWVVTESR